MSELEEARKHLRDCQEALALHRRMNYEPGFWDALRKYTSARVEQPVLAALSWVWDAQERDIYHQTKVAIERMAQVLKDTGVEPTTVTLSLPAARALGIA